ncbi:MAG: glycoside hydrolase family 3 C-terminal domain-containing protein [Desulfobacteraceae bacterium]|jgi:beta-glucosidase
MPTTEKLSESYADEKQYAKELVANMNLEEKALLLSGDGWWRTHEIKRLNIPSINFSDGPHGIRKTKEIGGAQGVPATCFPTASGLAATWNVDLINEVGAALGLEAQANDIQILLGPGVNMKRSPLGGRNFEYFSEDPFLTGKMAVAYIKGVQGEGVGTSLKHFAVNNQEFERMTCSSNLDECTLHEIYLSAFEMAVKQAKPWTVMSAYNLVNGRYASEHSELLTRILRDHWGFDGFVVSDWGGINDRVKSIMAGNNLEMPGSGDYNRRKIIEAVQNGIIPETILDCVVVQLLSVVLKARANRKSDATFDPDAHHALARRVAGEAIVLLKNTDNILPLSASKIALIGAFAKKTRFQGAGSSQVNPTQRSNVYDELVALTDNCTELNYASGYDDDGNTTDEKVKTACQAAAYADVAVVFAGLPDSCELEGADRTTIDLPPGHTRLIREVSAIQPNIVVVLMNGSAVSMPWVKQVKAVVEGWLGGQAGGGAIADVLTGKVNPSGKLSETFPVNLEQTPTYLNFPGRYGQVGYGEGVFVGYRYYDKKKIEPLFPFGFGLSYTRFVYIEINTDSSRFNINDMDEFIVTVKVKNVGKIAGKEVVQLYIRECQPSTIRPNVELKAFDKVFLKPGEERAVHFSLNQHAFAHYNPGIQDWEVKSGTFDVLVGGSSSDLPLLTSVDVQAATHAVIPLTRQSMIKDFCDHPKGRAYYKELLEAIGFEKLAESEDLFAAGDLTAEQIAEMQKAQASEMASISNLPVNKIPAFSNGTFTETRLNKILTDVAIDEES